MTGDPPVGRGAGDLQVCRSDSAGRTRAAFDPIADGRRWSLNVLVLESIRRQALEFGGRVLIRRAA